jgi:hypothetical protein
MPHRQAIGAKEGAEQDDEDEALRLRHGATSADTHRPPKPPSEANALVAAHTAMRCTHERPLRRVLVAGMHLADHGPEIVAGADDRILRRATARIVGHRRVGISKSRLLPQALPHGKKRSAASGQAPPTSMRTCVSANSTASERVSSATPPLLAQYAAV